MTQDELKKAVAEAALKYVEDDTIVGVGSGSTVNHFIDALAKINVDQSRLFAYFLSKLDALREGNSTLLDHSLIMYGSNLSVPTSHSQRDLPIIIAGGAAGRIANGRYIALPGDETPLSNLYLTMLEKVGVPMEKLGDSTTSI